MQSLILPIFNNNCVGLDSTGEVVVNVNNDVVTVPRSETIPIGNDVFSEIVVFRLMVNKYKLRFNSIASLGFVKPTSVIDIARNIDRAFSYRWSSSSREHVEWCKKLKSELETRPRMTALASEVFEPVFQASTHDEKERVTSFVDIVVYFLGQLTEEKFMAVLARIKPCFVPRISDDVKLKIKFVTVSFGRDGPVINANETALSVNRGDLSKGGFEVDKFTVGSAEFSVNCGGTRFISSHMFLTVKTTRGNTIVLSLSSKKTFSVMQDAYNCDILSKTTGSEVSFAA